MTMQFYLEVLISTGTATFEKAKHKIFNLSRLVNRSMRLNRNHFQPKIKMLQHKKKIIKLVIFGLINKQALIRQTQQKFL